MKKKSYIITLVVLFLSFPFFTGAQVVNVQTKIVNTDVEMVWEAHSYVPPFYKGKALYSVGGEVTVLAVPPEDLGNPSTLSYTWKKDATVDGAASGVGRRSYTFSGSEFGGSPNVVVEVSNGKQSAYGFVRLQQTKPVIRFYENKPLEGVVLEQALPRSFSTKNKDVTVEAYPYFFSARGRTDGLLSYTWSANGQKLSDAKGPSVAVQSEEPRSIIMQLSINSLTEILQRTEDSMTIIFEE